MTKQPSFTLFQKLSAFFRQTWRKSFLYRFSLIGRSPKHLSVMPTDPWPGDGQSGRRLLNGKILIAGHVIPLSDLWSPSQLDPDGLAELHKFNWLRDLRALGDNSTRRLARQLITHWIEQNQDWQSYSWNTDITGHRVANWIALYDFFCSSADETFRTVFSHSLARQVRHLTHSWQDASTPLARHCALKGLIYAAVTFPGESHHLKTYLAHLETELKNQILSDGGHNSRNPSLHLTILRDLIDIRAILRLIHHDIPSFLQAFISQMAPIVRFFRHGDGQLAYFSAPLATTSLIPSSIIDMVLSLSDVRGRPPERASALGFERCVNKSSLILLNVGPKTGVPNVEGIEEGTGSLNFEWSIGRNRLILQGDLILQTFEGDRFQVRLPEQKSIQLRRTRHQTDQGGHILLEANYARPDGLSFQHRRQLYLSENPIDLRGEDHIQVPTNAMYGLRFILAKNIEATISSGGRSILLKMKQDVPYGSDEPLKNPSLPNWRFLMSGAEEAHCEACGDHQAIILMGRAKVDQPACIQWAFRQE